MDPDCVCRDVQADFRDDIDSVKDKIHRYPESIRDLGDWCTVPKVVAIGPYYHRHHSDKLKQAEKAKHVAAYCCIQQSRGRPVEDLLSTKPAPATSTTRT